MNPHPALIFDPENDRSYTDWEEVVAGVQYVVINTPDWRVRSRYHPREVSSFDDFVRGLESRCSFFIAQYPVPDNLDVHHARCYSEMSYAARLAGVSDDPFRGVTRVVPEMLLLSPTQLGVTRDGQVEWRSHRGDRDHINYRPDRHLRGEERRHRHRLSAFIGYQDREVGALHPRPIFSRYCKVPQWWSEHEVPYQFRAQAPPVLTYRGLRFMQRHSPGWDLILRAEWAAMCAVELYEQAREGFLWWLPPRVMDDIESIGIRYMFDGAASHVMDDIQTLLWEIKCVRWDKVSNVNRFIPRFAQEPTPTFDNGDFVEFKTEKWRTELPSDMYLQLDHDHNPIGFIDRGQRLYGSTEGWPSYNNPIGRQAGLDDNAREPGYRLNERYGYSQSKWGIARSVVRNLAEQHGVISLLQDLGHRGPFDPKTFMEHYRELLLEKTARGRGDQQQIGGSVPPSQHNDTVLARGGPSTPVPNASNHRVNTPRASTPHGSMFTPSVPVVDITGSSNRVDAEVQPPRMASLPGSIADHAALVDYPSQRVTGLRSQPISTISQAPAVQEGGVQLGAVPSAFLEPSSDILFSNLRMQAYVELVREGKIHPVAPHPQHPNFESWRNLLLTRTIYNGANGCAFPRNINERIIVRVDPTLISQQNAPWEHGVPTMIQADGTLVADTVTGGPSTAVVIDTPESVAQAAVLEAQRLSGIDPPSNEN